MPKILSDQECLEAVEARAKHKSVNEAAEALGISWGTLDNRLRIAQKRGITTNTPTSNTTVNGPVSRTDREHLKLQRDNDALRSEIDKLVASREQDEYRKKVLQTLETEEKLMTIKPHSGGRGEAVAVIVASDWHIEERVDPKTVNERNEFNPEIAEERAKQFFANALWLVQKERKSVRIKKVILALLGDFISGYIHPELIESNYMSPTDAIQTVRRFLVSGIDYLLSDPEIEQLIIPCTYGNHGRTTEKSRINTGAENSYEYLLYCWMADRFEGNPRVKFVISRGQLCMVKTFNHVIRFHHGDAVNYGGGVGGITVPVHKAIDAWNDAEELSPRKVMDVFGHFHQLTFSNRFVCNGSLIGHSPYAIRIKARYEEPRQAFFLMDRDEGRTVMAPIFVTKKQQREQES